MVGKRIEVFRPDDASWYDGEVVALSVENGKHTIFCTDGDRDDVVLAEEKFALAADADREWDDC